MSARSFVNDTTSTTEMMNSNTTDFMNWIGSNVTTAVATALPVTYSSAAELMVTTVYLTFTSVSKFSLHCADMFSLFIEI